MFTVGQEVWSTLFGKGIVISIDEQPEYPIKVKFKENFSTFTAEGVWDDEGPSLFPYPVKVVPEDIPDYPFILDGKPVKVGDKVQDFDGSIKRIRALYWDGVEPAAELMGLLGIYRLFSGLKWPSAPEPLKRWAYLIAGMPGPMSIGFTEPMPESEAREKYGQVWEVPEGEK